MPDQDGYGYTRADRGVDRLLEDLRTASPATIARIAEGWDGHASGAGHERFHDAEREALTALENADLAPAWEDLRRRVLELTEGSSALIDWKAEHGAIGHKAEAAVLAGAMALLVEDRLPRNDYMALVTPAAEALPWLLN